MIFCVGGTKGMIENFRPHKHNEGVAPLCGRHVDEM